MKKVIKLKDLDCAVCAAKMEKKIAEIEGVNDVTVSYVGQKIVLDVSDGSFDRVVEEMKKVCRKVEPDCVLLA